VDSAEGSLHAAQGWWHSPREKKLDDATEAGGGGLVDLSVNVATGAAIGAVVRACEARLELAGDFRKVERTAIKGKKAAQLAEEIEQGASASAKGGTYVLQDPDTGQVMRTGRTGRTKDHKRREQEHRQHPATEELEYRSEPPTMAATTGRRRESALTVADLGDLGFLKDEWLVIGQQPHWNRADWPLPLIAAKDGPRLYLCTLQKEDESELVQHQRITQEEADRMGAIPRVIYGDKALSITVDKLLAEREAQTAA
jgi:hypothetical protein